MIHYIDIKNGSNKQVVKQWISILRVNKIGKITANSIFIPSNIFVQLLHQEILKKPDHTIMLLHFTGQSSMYTNMYSSTYIVF